MPVIYIAESRQAIQYTGSNSGALNTAITDFAVDSEAAGVLTFTSSGNQLVANTGDWVTFWQGYANGVYTNAQFLFYFVENAVGTDVLALQATIAGVGSAALRSAGVASAGTLLLNTPANVAVQLIPAMADTSYTPYAYLFGTGVNLGQVTVNSVTITDADTVTVQVQTTLLSLPGVNILVVAKD